jgi:hypothetical protein
MVERGLPLDVDALGKQAAYRSNYELVSGDTDYHSQETYYFDELFMTEIEGFFAPLYSCIRDLPVRIEG